MNLSEFALDALKGVIAVESGETPYFSGPQLIKLFNHVGFRDTYRSGFTGEGLRSNLSRRDYTLNRLERMNKSRQLKDFIEHFVNHALAGLDPDQEAKFFSRINQIIKPEGYIIEKIDEEYRVIGNDVYEDQIEATAHFEDIQKQIIDEIRNAKYMIWAAVAWFTDDAIFNELVSKSKEGVNVQVIINDDEINARAGLPFEDYFETHKIPQRGMYGNIMHNKFCVIDLKTVISGSYNWTKKAAYNNESIEVKQGRELAEQYAAEFIKLKNTPI